MHPPVQTSEAARQIFALKQSVANANWLLIIGCFIYYFLGGYLFYASLFAAVGCVVNEDPQEAQSLLLPISMPIIFSFIIMTIAVQDPGGSLAVWASMIPFSSPIVMMARIPYGVPGGGSLLAAVALHGAAGWQDFYLQPGWPEEFTEPEY